jgi:hypothetical protein
MKLFQQLLVAPAALGLLAPMAATAAELNINDVSDYSSASSEEVKSISQFSDVYPTDWAYQALENLRKRHGCNFANPNGSMTRYEAAALLNKCIGNVAQLNTEEQSLVDEFGPELAVIKGRVDSLEARVGEFEAGVFSTTTKLSGNVAMVIGGVEKNTSAVTDATTFTYKQQFDLRTSFTGSDMLYTRVKTGNFGSSQFDEKPGAYLSDANSNDNFLKVDKIWYQFPVGDSWTVWVGPAIENYYMLASAPSIYKPVLKGFALGGNGATYGASTGQGMGAAWTQQVEDRSQARFAVSANYTASSHTGTNSNPDDGGFLTNGSKGMTLVKVEYGSPRYQVSAAFSHKDRDADGGSYYSTTLGQQSTGDKNSIALRTWWRPESTGWMPSVSVGYDFSSIDEETTDHLHGKADAVKETNSWMVGFNWKDVVFDGNTAGLAFGQRQHATSRADGSDDPATPFQWEMYYSFKVSDNITITPALFQITEPAGGTDDDVLGGIVTTKFKF